MAELSVLHQVFHQQSLKVPCETHSNVTFLCQGAWNVWRSSEAVTGDVAITSCPHVPMPRCHPAPAVCGAAPLHAPLTAASPPAQVDGVSALVENCQP